MNKISVSRLGRGASLAPVERYTVKRAAAAVLELEGYPPSLVSVVYTSDAGMQKLNLRTRGMDKATDVLSFPGLEIERGKLPQARAWEMENGLVLLGDVVISVDRARRQAAEYGHSVERELAFLTIHAVLHLMGYDHERSKAEERAHFKRQDEILEAIGL